MLKTIMRRLDWLLIPLFSFIQITNRVTGELQRVRVDSFVYARHGRELMGLKSPVSVPVLGFNLA